MSAKKNLAEVSENVSDEIVNDTPADTDILSEETAEVITDDEENRDWRELARANGATEEEIKNMEKFFRKTSFYAKPMIKDGSRAARKAYAGEVIISEDDEEETTTTAYKNDVRELNASARSQRVLRGRIVGCKAAGGSISTNLAIVSYGSETCTVYIPDYCLFHFDVDPSGKRTPDEQKRLAKMIEKRIGSDISFIVKQFDQNTNTAYADRLKAMEQSAYNNYVRPQNNTHKPRVRVGDTVKGQITAVTSKYITVYALGVETNIYQKKDEKHNAEVSWYHYDDLRQVYKVNDPIACKVLSVNVSKVKKYAEEYTLVAAELSAKQVHKDPQVEFYDKYDIGQVYQCEITACPENGPGVYGLLSNGTSKVDVLVSFPRFGDIPEVGDVRIVKITDKADKTEQGALLEKDGRQVRRIFGVFADT